MGNLSSRWLSLLAWLSGDQHVVRTFRSKARQIQHMGNARGRDYTTYKEEVVHYRANGKHVEAIALLNKVIAVGEHELQITLDGACFLLWSYSQLADFHFMCKQQKEEAEALQRYVYLGKQLGEPVGQEELRLMNLHRKFVTAA